MHEELRRSVTSKLRSSARILKRWPRAWKVNLIERSNPDWHDMYPAMRKYEPNGPLTGAVGKMGPGQLRHLPTADGLAQDDS